MNCPCEVLVQSPDHRLGERLLAIAIREAARIEDRFSRYKAGNMVDRMNTAAGKPITVDAECAALLDYAAQCYEISEGLFDITTGVLRQAWTFEGQEATLDPQRLEEALARVGWNRVTWEKPSLQLPEGFEIDFGGLCKEYAADRILSLLRQETDRSVLINLGGDIAAAGTQPWAVGLEDPRKPGVMLHTIPLPHGAIATSGSTKRFTKIGQAQLSHILDPKTGWPVKDVPLSVTVTAASCTEAGLWSTLGMLHGARAEEFLKETHVEHWCAR